MTGTNLPPTAPGWQGDQANKLVSDPTVRVVYFAVLIFLVLMIVYYVKAEADASGAEHYYGYPLPKTIQYAAGGPDLRFQEFTSTNQGSTPDNIPTYLQTHPNALGGSEHMMTGERQAPDFWTVSNILGAYQYVNEYGCSDGSNPIPNVDTHGNITYTCGNGSLATPIQGSVGSASSMAPSKKSAVGSTTSSGAEFATSNPNTAVQEALLMRKLGY